MRALGLGGPAAVTCVARGLKALTGFGARALRGDRRRARTRSSSTSASAAPTARWRTVVDRAEVTRLGEGLTATGRLDAARDRAHGATAIAGMADEARRLGAVAIAAVGTAGLRIAPNAPSSSTPSARAAASRSRSSPARTRRGSPYVGGDRRRSGRRPARCVVFDTGGGSSQFTFGDGDDVAERFSVERRRGALHRALRPRPARSPSATLAASAARRSPPSSSGSTARPAARGDRRHGRRGHQPRGRPATGCAVYDPDVVHGTVLDRAEIDRQIELYRTLGAEQRRAIVGLQPNRAEVILAGACIVRTVLHAARRATR